MDNQPFWRWYLGGILNILRFRWVGKPEVRFFIGVGLLGLGIALPIELSKVTNSPLVFLSLLFIPAGITLLAYLFYQERNNG